MKIDDSVALVTGAGQRVGRALAASLASKGANLAIHYNSSAKGAEALASEVRKAGVTAKTFQADLADASSPAALVEKVTAAFGRLDILVNSAAIMERSPFGETDATHWDRVIALNLRAPFMLAQAAAPHLRRARGAVVNIADLAAFETWPGYIPHGVSKSGVVYITRALALVLAPDVRVNAIAPGNVLLPEGWSKAEADRLVQTTPLKRDGSPEDVAAAMLFLLESDFITGDTIIVDGGRHVRK